MTNSGLSLAVLLALVGAIVVVHAGIVTNQSTGTETVSSSVSTSSSAAAAPAKPSRVGKVLYTAPYSNVRPAMTQEGKLLEGRLRSFGPVLVKAKKTEEGDQEASSTTSTTTTTTTTSTSTTAAPTEAEVVLDTEATTLTSDV